ncbi:hypothetical protein [Bradyrhizobium sp. Bra64]|uniref:hypothetical protein n=1 Tax=Bradyrhizobium sp. Bra64 TaxID=2926009 RepID=UPI0021197A9E|nr:hypothetical protein [Bradyrhizobium sp. Bra64]
MKTNTMTFAEVVAAFEAAGFWDHGEFGLVTYAFETASDGTNVQVVQSGAEIMTFRLDADWCLDVWTRERFNEQLARKVGWARKSIAA